MGLVFKKANCLPSFVMILVRFASLALFVEDIFHLTIDKNLTVNNLEAEIKTVRQDLQEINIDLYKKDFAQDNNALVSTVNTDEKNKEY